MKMPKTLEISKWYTPATDYPERQIGSFRIHRSKQSRGYYNYWGLDGYLFWRVRKPILITNLQEKRDGEWHSWMVDDPPQQRAMEIYAANAHGRVLVAGLGLGLILHELAKNHQVTQVTVVEKSPEVGALVGDYLPSLPEFVILLDDFYYFINSDNNSWDTILVDLWVSGSEEEKMQLFYQQVLPLHAMLALKYHGSEITYHGFQTVSAIKPVSEEMAKLVIEINGRR